LHFGMLAPVSTGARQYGGVGVMVRRPGIELAVQRAPEWRAAGPLCERALAFARQFYAAAPKAELDGLPPAVAIAVESAGAEHIGLGTGTQLGLAVARALSMLAGRPALGAMELARRVARGRRSAIGVHGFEHGGLVVDGGKTDPDAVAPLVAQMSLPDDWQFVLVVPHDIRGLHGPAEREAFRELGPVLPSITAELCRMVLLGLLPAAAEQDFAGFSQRLYEFGQLVGRCFASCQGGVFAHPRLFEIAEFIRSTGVTGVGQSSWGPTLFALTADYDAACTLVRRLEDRFGTGQTTFLISAVDNSGAETTVSRA
jgi:beta-RFAP synthase